MVARIAHFWRRLPHEIWELPFTYYVTLRDEYIDMVTPPEEREGFEGDLSLERLDQLAQQGIVDINYDAVLRHKRRRKAG